MGRPFEATAHSVVGVIPSPLHDMVQTEYGLVTGPAVVLKGLRVKATL